MATPAAILNIAVTANTAQANAALAKTQTQLSATGKTAAASSAVMKKAFLGIGVAAVGAATALYKIGESFDDVSDTISKQTGATGKKLKGLEDSFKNVVKTVPTDFDSAATAIAGLNQRLNITGKPLEKLTKQVTQLALVTGTDVQENVEAVTRLFGDWEVATKDQTETLDGLFRLSQKTGTSVSDLSRNLVQFGAPLRNLGIDMDFAAAMFANFEKTGVNMTTVLSGLRLGVGNLNAPTDELKRTLDRLDISLKNPQTALTEIFDSIKKLDTQAATALGIQAFGKRAGPDLVDTVRGGKFELDKLIATFKTGDETISGAERRTRDFSEQWQLFKNQVMVALQPVATKFFEVIGDGMKMLRKLDLGPAIQSLKDFWKEAGVVRETFSKVSDAIKDNLQGLAQFIEGTVKVISGILTLDFGRAWEGVKDIFSAGAQNILNVLKVITAPFRAAAEKIAELLTRIIGGAWRTLKTIIAKSADFILGTITTIIDGFASMADAGSKIPGPIGDAWDKVQAGAEDTSDAINKTREDLRRWAGDGVDASKKMRKGIAENLDGLSLNVSEGMGFIAAVTNKALAAFGVKQVAFDLAGGIAQGAAQGHQKGGIIHAAAGTMVPGFGNGDKVPAMLEPGEVVINKKAVAAMGGANRANAINAMIPRFAKGGTVPGATSGLHPGILGLVNSLYQRFGGSVSSGLRAGDSGSLHSTGQAADYVPSNWAGASSAVNAVGSKLLEGIYNPGAFGGSPVSWDTGAHVSPSFWGAEWGNHLDHIHLAIADGVSAAAGAAVKQIKRVMLSGPDGALKSMGQAALDKVRGAANSYLSKHTGFTGDTSTTSSGAYKGPLDKVFPHPTTVSNPGIALSAAQVAGLASKAGLNGDTFEKISRGESGHHPGIVGYDPGGTRGYGLWQITSGYNDDIINRFGGVTQMFNPWVNAQAAKAIFDRQGIGAWQGTQYLAKGGVAGVYNDFIRSGSSMTPGGKPPSYAPNPFKGTTSRGGAALPASLASAIYGTGTAAKILEEQISNREVYDAFSTSEMGTALGPAEKIGQIALNKSLLEKLIQGAYLAKQALAIPFLDTSIASALSEGLIDLQGLTGSGGKILTVRQKLDSLGAPDTSTTDSGPDLSQQIALLNQQLLEANQRFNVSQAQYGVFAGMRAAGGYVGAGQWAIAGERGPEVVAGPANVYSSGDSASMLSPNVTVTIEGGPAMAWLKDFVKVEVDGQTRRQARSRPLPGVRG